MEKDQNRQSEQFEKSVRSHNMQFFEPVEKEIEKRRRLENYRNQIARSKKIEKRRKKNKTAQRQRRKNQNC